MTFEAPGVKIVLGDCMEGMAGMRDGEFELAICDPPYGINHAEIAGRQGGSQYGNAAAAKKEYAIKLWDSQTPSSDYFYQLFRISKNQIIWGANYMVRYLPPSIGWIFWDKDNGDNGYSDGELAFTSFKCGLRKVKYTWNGMLQHDMKNKEKRIHPTQKPVRLYQWLLKNYAKPGDHILDTHGGSMSSVIAANIMGYDITCYEIDEEYFTAGVERVKRHLRQGVLDL